MSAIYEVPSADRDEHVYCVAQTANGNGNGICETKGDNSTGFTTKTSQHVTIGLLILLIVLIVAVLGVSLYSLQMLNGKGTEPSHSQSTDRHRLKQSQVGCGVPNVTALIPGEMVKQNYAPNEEVHGLTCEPGQRLVGNSSLVCLEDGSWRGSTACDPVECPLPKINGTIGRFKESYSPGEMISWLTCGPGKQLIGNSSLVCQEDGTWSGTASCVQTATRCPPPKVNVTIPIGKIKKSYSPGDVIDGLTCGPYGQVVGNSSLVCKADGTWRGNASCEPGFCMQNFETTVKASRKNGDTPAHDLYHRVCGKMLGSPAVVLVDMGPVAYDPRTQNNVVDGTVRTVIHQGRVRLRQGKDMSFRLGASCSYPIITPGEYYVIATDKQLPGGDYVYELMEQAVVIRKPDPGIMKQVMDVFVTRMEDGCAV